jgi:hypothetical protein|nr:MAG TPA: hypothetical protein [Caudoviricetes sp.]
MIGLIGAILFVAGLIITSFISYQIGMSLIVVGLIMIIVALWGKCADWIEKVGLLKTILITIVVTFIFAFIFLAVRG